MTERRDSSASFALHAFSSFCRVSSTDTPQHSNETISWRARDPTTRGASSGTPSLSEAGRKNENKEKDKRKTVAEAEAGGEKGARGRKVGQEEGGLR
jgi:hypothetical protein